MSDEEVDELLKGFPVQYVFVHFFISSFSFISVPLYLIRYPLFSSPDGLSLVMEGKS
jgi:hypothetical protein